jgi:predicted cupin superfamily sugar epimerase
MKAEQKNARYWINHLSLNPHPEGGFFREVYRSSEEIAHTSLPSRFSGARNFSTSIYYLLEKGDFSAFHRIKSDETWHFYRGGALDLHILNDGAYQLIVIGADVANSNHLQYTVQAGAWFASQPSAGSWYSLVGCTVSPGFDFADFEMAKREELEREYSKQISIIAGLTRG